MSSLLALLLHLLQMSFPTGSLPVVVVDVEGEGGRNTNRGNIGPGGEGRDPIKTTTLSAKELLRRQTKAAAAAERDSKQQAARGIASGSGASGSGGQQTSLDNDPPGVKPPREYRRNPPPSHTDPNQSRLADHQAPTTLTVTPAKKKKK